MAAPSQRRLGRRPGQSATREAILASARELFAEKGYDGASVRGIARRAEVDPALVHHYFGSKQGIFIAAMQFPLDPDIVFERIADTPRERIGPVLVRTFLEVWGDPARRDPILAMLRSAMTNEQVATVMREFVTSALLARAAEHFDVPRLPVTAAAGQMIGVVMLRYVLKVEPLASATEDELVELLGPTLQRYFDS